jgi:hypothetical protein
VLITRPEESYRLSLCSTECDFKASIMRLSWPTGVCCAIEKKNTIILPFR